MTTPRTQYARSHGASIAYHVVEDGPVNLVYAPGPTSQVELMWEEPVTARYLHRIASFARLVMFDRRGTGLSDPVDRAPTLEQQMDDVQAVIRAADLERTSLFGVSDSGLCALYAAMHPGEVTSMVLWGVAGVGSAGRDARIQARSRPPLGHGRRWRLPARARVYTKAALSQGRIGTRREPWAARGPAGYRCWRAPLRTGG